MNTTNKSGKGHRIDSDQEQRAIDKLEEMWDRELAKGDDEFYDSVNPRRSEPGKENEKDEEHRQQPRRKGRRM
jgi:hypothetical protein